MAVGRIGLEQLQDAVAQRAAAGGRVIVALAGAPGSGKSTLAELLAEGLNRDHPARAAVLPMDGFHYDDLHLVPAGLRPRKGAPDTFDVGGLVQTLQRIRDRREAFVAVPVFDRDLEIARAGARMIAATTDIIIVEGNYLLVGQEPWSALRPLFDIAVLVEVPEAVLRARLRARWEHYGLSEDEIGWKLDGNDLPNGRFVMEASCLEDYRLTNV